MRATTATALAMGTMAVAMGIVTLRTMAVATGIVGMDGMGALTLRTVATHIVAMDVRKVPEADIRKWISKPLWGLPR